MIFIQAYFSYKEESSHVLSFSCVLEEKDNVRFLIQDEKIESLVVSLIEDNFKLSVLY